MYVGFDIGGTSIKYGVVDNAGNILEKASIPTNHEKEAFFADLEQIVADMKEKYDLIAGIGISAPGIIRKDGYMITAGALLPLYGENIKVTMEQRTGLPVSIENDANAAAIAERWVGNAQGFNNYLVIVLGTGVGGGIVINGDVFRGDHGMAGEFGFMVLDELPEDGDIEQVSLNRRASVVGGLCRLYNEAKLAEDPNAEAIKDARIVFQRETAGEAVAKKVLDRYFIDLSVALLNLISCFDPEAILIGGGISANETFNTRLQETLAKITARHSSLNYLSDKTVAPVMPAKLKNDAGLVGAVYQVQRMVTGQL